MLLLMLLQNAGHTCLKEVEDHGSRCELCMFAPSWFLYSWNQPECGKQTMRPLDTIPCMLRPVSDDKASPAGRRWPFCKR
jgi:hypothetical protein